MHTHTIRYQSDFSVLNICDGILWKSDFNEKENEIKLSGNCA